MRDRLLKELENFSACVEALGALAAEGANEMRHNDNKILGMKDIKSVLGELDEHPTQLTHDQLRGLCSVIYNNNRKTAEIISNQTSRMSIRFDCEKEKAGHVEESTVRKSLKNRQQTPGKPPRRIDEDEEEEEDDEVDENSPAQFNSVKTVAPSIHSAVAPHSVLKPLASNLMAPFVPPSAIRASRHIPGLVNHTPLEASKPSPLSSLTPDMFLLSPSIQALQSKYNRPSISPLSMDAPTADKVIESNQTDNNNEFSGFPQLQEAAPEEDTQSLWNQVIRSHGISTSHPSR